MRRALLIGLIVAALFPVRSAAQTTHVFDLSWKFYPNASASDMTQLYLYEATLNGTTSIVAPTCVDDTCTVRLPGSFASGTEIAFSFRVACVSAPTTFGSPTPTVTFTAGGPIPDIPTATPPPNPCLAPTTPPAPPTILGPCTYAAPGSTTTEPRPIGQMMQGFNAIGPSGVVNNQADRIRQLKAWGWEITLAQFVSNAGRTKSDGSPDPIDRLFLIVTCRGQ